MAKKKLDISMIQFRLAKDGSDDDIKKAFNINMSLTDRAKELIRLGIEYEAVQLLESKNKVFFAKQEAVQPSEPKSMPKRDIDWNASFPKEPTVKPIEKKDDKKIMANILAGFD